MASSNFKKGKRPLSLWLEEYEDQGLHPYYCPDCSHIIFIYQGQVVSEVPGMPEIKPTDIYIEVRCANVYCGRVVYLMGFSKRLPEFKENYK